MWSSSREEGCRLGWEEKESWKEERFRNWKEDSRFSVMVVGGLGVAVGFVVGEGWGLISNVYSYIFFSKDKGKMLDFVMNS